MFKKLRDLTIMMLSVFMVMISVNAYQKNISLSLSSVSKTVDSGETANFTMDFKTTGSTQDLSKVNVEVDLPEGYELLTPLSDLSLMGVEPELVDNQLRYVLEDVKTGISQKNVLTFSTENGIEFNDDLIALESRIIVDDEVIENSKASSKINAVGNLTVAKVVSDVDGKGKYAVAKKDSSIKWQLRIASDKQESAQLFIEPDSKIKLVDTLPKFVKYVSDSHGGEYDAASHTVTWYFDAPSIEEQKLSEDYLFLETIEIETKVTGISGTSYYEEITNNAVGELTQLDGTKISRSANASTTITGGSNVEIPAGGSWYRGNFRGPSDQNNGIASSTKPNPQIEAFDTAKLSFRHSYYIHEGTGTSLYVGNKKLGANETRNQYNIGFYDVAKKGYQFIDFTYDIGEGLVLETIRIRKPRLDIRSDVPDSEFIVGELPIATLEITTDDGRQFSHLIDFREFSGISKTFNITDITGGEQVIVKSYKLKFRPNESQKNINGHFALPFNIMGYRVKPGSRGKVTNSVKAEYKIVGDNRLIKYIGESVSGPLGDRSVNLVQRPKGTPAIVETNVSFAKDYSGVVLPGKNEIKLEVQNLDGSLDNLTGNYEVYLKAPRNLELDLDKVKLTDGFSLVSAESVGEFDRDVIYKFEVKGPIFGIGPSEKLLLKLPVDIVSSGSSRINLDIYLHSQSSDVETPKYPSDIEVNTVHTPKKNPIYQSGSVDLDKKLVSSGNSYSMVKKEELITRKLVKGSLDESFENFGHVNLGGEIDYKLELLHTFGSPVRELVIVDTLPGVDDLGITDNVERGSKFELNLTGPLVLNDSLSDCFDVYYSTEKLIKRTDLNNVGSNQIDNPVGSTDPNWKTSEEIVDWGAVRSFKLVLKPNRSWDSDEPLTIDFSMRAPEELDVDLLSISKDDPFKYEKAAWNSFAVAMANLQIIEPSRVGIAVVDEIPVENPLVDKFVVENDELIKESTQELDAPFTYLIKTQLPESVNGYKNLVIEDVLHESLDILEVKINGEVVDSEYYENNRLSIVLDRIELINMVKNGITAIDVEIKVKLTDVKIDGNFNAIPVLNTAKVTVNGEEPVEPETPTVVTPKIEYGEISVVVTEGEHEIVERDSLSDLGDVRLEGSIASIKSTSNHDFDISIEMETIDEDVISRLPVGEYEIKQIKVIDGYLITTSTLLVEVKSNELTVVEILNPKEPTPAEFVSEKHAEGKINGEFATPEEELLYRINIKNIGETVGDVFVQDDLVEILDYVDIDLNQSLTFEGYDLKESYRIKDLVKGFTFELPGETEISLLFEVTLKDKFDEIEFELINKAKVNEEEIEGKIKVKSPKIEMSKTMIDENGDGKAEANEILTYTITVSNIGKAKAEKVIVKDDFTNVEPFVKNISHVILKQGVSESVFSIDDLKIGIPIDLEVDETKTISFSVQVKDDLEDGQEILNTAYADDEEDEVKITHHTPKVYINKSVEDENHNGKAEMNETLTYTITVGNSGVVGAKNVLVKDDLSDIEDYVKDVSDVILTQGTEETRYSLDQLQDGIEINLASKEEVTFVFTVRVKEGLEDGIEFLNTAYANDEEDDVKIPHHLPKVYVKKEVQDENGDGIAEANETLTYIVTVGNTGIVSAQDVNVKVRDDISEMEEFISDISDVVLTQKDMTTTYTIEEFQAGIPVDLDAEEIVTFVFTVKVNDDLEDGQEQLNVVYADDEESEIKITHHTPQVYISKSVEDENNNDIAEANEILTYTITVGNKGVVTAKDVLVKDDLGGIEEFVTDISEVILTQDGKTTSFTIDELRSGISLDLESDEEVTLVFTVKVKDNLEDGQKLLNTVYADEEDDEVEITYHDPKVYVSKSVEDENNNDIAEANETLTYTITVGNKGVVKAKDVLVKDDLSGIEEFVTDISEVILTQDGKTTSFTIDELRSGISLDLESDEEVTFVFTVKVKDDLDDGQKLLNTVYADEEENEVEITYHDPKVYVSKSVEDENGNGLAEANETLTYTITVGNKGVVTAKDVLIKDDLSGIEEFVTDISEVILTQDGKTTSFAIDELRSGISLDLESEEEVTLVFTVKVKDDLDDGQKLLNTVYADEEEDEVEITYHDPKVYVSKSVEDENNNDIAEANETLTYTITVGNKGVVKAKDVLVKDDLSGIEEFVTDISEVNLTQDGKTTSFTIDELRSGISLDLESDEEVTFVFTVKVKDNLEDGQKLLNTVYADEEEDEVEITYHDPKVYVSKSVEDENNNDIAEANETLTYTITVGNKGVVTAKDVLVKDDLSGIEEFVTDISEVILTQDGKTTSFTIDELRSGISLDLESDEEVTFVFTVKVKDDLDDGQKLLNTVYADEEENEVEITYHDPKVYVSKSVEDENGNGLAEANETLIYTITVGNRGGVMARDVVVRDDLSDMIDYVYDVSDVELERVGGKFSYTIDQLMSGIVLDIAPHESMEFRFTVRVKDNLDDGQKLLNTVYVDEEEDDVTIVYHEAKLQVLKVSQDEVKAGEDLTFEIQITNVGNVPVKNVIVKDSLDELLSYIINPKDVDVYLDGEVYGKVSDLMKGMILAQLDVGEKRIISFTVRTKNSLPKELNEVTNTVFVDDETSTVRVPVIHPDKPPVLPTTGAMDMGIVAWSFIIAGLGILLRRRRY